MIDYSQVVNYEGARTIRLLPKFGGSWWVEKLTGKWPKQSIVLKKCGSARRKIFTPEQFNKFSKKQDLYFVIMD